MNEVMIFNHNEVVTDEDVVYHLGDFAFGDPARYLFRLKGKDHYLIVGNHDKRNACERVFRSVQDVLLLQIENQKWIWLSHYAHRVWPHKHQGAFHLFGHSHGVLKSEPGSMDVGVDSQGFRPLTLAQVLNLIPPLPELNSKSQVRRLAIQGRGECT